LNGSAGGLLGRKTTSTQDGSQSVSASAQIGGSSGMNIVIIGGGGHGKVVIDIVEKAEGFHLLGILDSQLPVGHKVMDCDVLGTESSLPKLIDERAIQGVVIAIGDNWLRSKTVESLQSLAPGIKYPNAVHPSAQLAKNVRLGRGNVVMAGCVVNSNATIGDFCILNTNCSVDHDSILGNYVSFAPKACAGGNVQVGDYSSVCLGANIIHGVKVGQHTLIGAGATVLNDLPSQVVAYGTPACVIRNRSPGEKFL
jgi:sugar O-acyltransferase (sialic acid O-acetyltransferase NeuD family)